MSTDSVSCADKSGSEVSVHAAVSCFGSIILRFLALFNSTTWQNTGYRCKQKQLNKNTWATTTHALSEKDKPINKSKRRS